MTDQGTKPARSFEGFSDHDLLIRILTLQEVQTSDIRGLRADNARLWAEKAAQTDLVLVRAAVEALRISKTDATVTADQEKRLRAVERTQAISWGVVLAASAIMQLLVKLLWH